MSVSGQSKASSTVPPEPLEEGDFRWNGLSIEGPPYNLEKIGDYDQGGHHPVHLGDLIQDGRYRVIHKLGSGGFANVWLCRDTESLESTKYVALKILMGDASTDDCREPKINEKLGSLHPDLDQEPGARYISSPLNQFQIQGPNGSHICFVYPVLGPRVISPVSHSFENPDQSLRATCLKCAQAVDYLHSHDICHGDFTPANILFQTTGLDSLSEGEIIKVFGEPQQTRVLAESRETPTDPSAPRYLIYPVDWDSVNPKYVTDQPCIIDFGEAFEVSDPPEHLGIPGPYRSPELMLDQTIGFSTDNWALGCAMFEIRTGRKLIHTFDDDQDDYLIEMVQMMGPLPEPWWSTTWESRKEWFKDEPDSQGRVLYKNPPPPAEPNPMSSVHPSIVQDARSLQEKLGAGVWYMDAGIHRDMSKEEIEVFANLLGKVLSFDPKDRLTAKGVQEHEWFKM